MVELGVLTPEQAARHPSRHELTQYLGILEKEMLIQPAFSEIIKLQPGDIFLLCSDGLTDMVSEKDIAVCLANGGHTQTAGGRSAANGSGGWRQRQCNRTGGKGV